MQKSGRVQDEHPGAQFARHGYQFAPDLVVREPCDKRFRRLLVARASKDSDAPVRLPIVMSRSCSERAVMTAGRTAPESSDTSSSYPAITADWDADRAVTALYSLHYRSLVRLAAMLVRDLSTAEEIVQDSFVRLHMSRRRLADSERAVSYLRQAVVNRSRSVLRHRVIVDKPAPKMAPQVRAAAQEEIAPAERSVLVSVLSALPPRQREVLVLRYYADLSEAQIASTMGISRGVVKRHTARAMSAMRTELRRAADGASAEPGDDAQPTGDGGAGFQIPGKGVDAGAAGLEQA